MCGCRNKTTVTSTVNNNCSITAEQLDEMKLKLTCIKDYGYEPVSQINSYLGIVISALYYPSDFCYYKSTLDEINSFLITRTEC